MIKHMCYSFESSISSWVITFILCVIMLVNPQTYSNWLPLFILTFTQIQIMEAILWSNMDSENKQINQSTTKLLSFMLWLQPLMNTFIAYKNTKEDLLFYGIYFYVLIIIFHYLSSRNDTFITDVGTNGHLQWNRRDEKGNDYSFVLGNKYMCFLYLAGVFLPFIFMQSDMKYLALTFFSGTFLLSALKYKKEFGSMWCYYSIFASIMVMLCQE